MPNSSSKQKVMPAQTNMAKMRGKKRKEHPDNPGQDVSAENGNADSSGEASAGGHRKIANERQEEEPTACLCARKYEEGDKMIGCDGPCKRWYHIECVGVSPEEFDRFTKDKKCVWKCSYCIKGISPPSSFNANLSQTTTIGPSAQGMLGPMSASGGGFSRAAGDAGRKKKKMGK